jgi:hypothetical protein
MEALGFMRGGKHQIYETQKRKRDVYHAEKEPMFLKSNKNTVPPLYIFC